MIRASALTLLALFATTLPAHADQSRIIVGWIEKVHIDALDSIYKAKMDTGATTSSIDAKIIKLIEPGQTRGKRKIRRKNRRRSKQLRGENQG